MTASARNKPWLAGVCGRIAGALNWNAWAVRLLFVLFFMINAVSAVLVYAALALLFYLADRAGTARGSRTGGVHLDTPGLASREQRINDLDRRFREWERSLDR